jgi:TRAP-type C4-dicarboxylate transport system substrate-binding protein
MKPLQLRAPVIALLAAVFAMPYAAADTVIKLAHPNRNDSFDNSTAAMAVVFKSVLETNSGGEIRVDIYPEGQLGKDTDVVKLVANDIIAGLKFEQARNNGERRTTQVLQLDAAEQTAEHNSGKPEADRRATNFSGSPAS